MIETLLAVIAMPAVAVASYLFGRSHEAKRTQKYIHHLCDVVSEYSKTVEEK